MMTGRGSAFIAVFFMGWLLSSSALGTHVTSGSGRSPAAGVGASNQVRLGRAGFLRFGESDVFARGNTLVRADEAGTLTLFKDLYPNIDLGGIRAIGSRALVSPKVAVMAILDAKGLVHFDNGAGYSGSGPNGTEGLDLSGLRGMAFEKQLLWAGFSEDPAGTGVFRKSQGAVEFLALVRNGRLVRLARAERTNLLAGASVRAPRAGEERAGRGLLLANRWMHFEYSSEQGVVKQSVTFLSDLKSSPPPLLKSDPFLPVRDKGGSPFLVGGNNSTDTIRGLKSLNGQTIAQLEARMRPEQDSNDGFLGKSERLLDVLAADNDYVVGKRGLTHAALAAPMHLIRRIAEEGLHEGKDIVYNGQRLRIEVTQTHGTQFSPFDDGTNHGTNVVVTNRDTNASVAFSLLVPFLVERYGFYEGRGTPYRVEPESIIRVFGLAR